MPLDANGPGELMAGWPETPEPRVAFITGAAHGIGAGTAEALASGGWRVALVDLDLAAAEAVAARIGDTAAAFEADVTSSEALEAAVAGAVERFGRLDACFANAGIGTGGAMRHLDPDVFAVTIEINLIGAFRTVRACLPHIVESKGYVLLNASASALLAPPGVGAYGASKAGIESTGDTLRREVKHLGVDVGVLYLLWVDTDMVTGTEEKIESFARLRAGLRGPLGRTMPLREAVETIVTAIEGRRRRAMAPKLLHAVYRIRGIGQRLLERDFTRLAPTVDELSAAELAERGLEGAMRTDTAAGAAAAEAVERRR